MKLKNKLYLTQFFIILTLIFFLWVMYVNLNKHIQQDLDSDITKNTNINKLLLRAALEDTYKTFDKQKILFTHIHRTALDELKKDENISLIDLKNKIISLFNLKDLDIDLFMINKHYVIVDATFEKDIGLDFKNIPDGKRDLDKASKDDDIHIGENIAIDYMDSTIKIYSCARIKPDKFLEIAFIDPSVYNKLRTRIDTISKSTQNTIHIFRISKTSSNDEYYEDIMSREKIINKQEWKDRLKKFPLASVTEDNVINAKRQNEIIRSDKNVKKGMVTVYIPLLSKENDPSLGYNNFVLKLDININDYLTQLKEDKTIFIFLLFILFILMILLYFFIKDHFYIPITTITQNFENEAKIDDPNLLRKQDEFGVLTEKYNALYTKLQDQVEENQHLLDENRQFIADMVHQIRTPLSVIMTNTSLIEMSSEPKVSSYVTQINSAINMLSNSYEDLSYVISNDVLEYTPIEINLTDFLHERINFFEVIADANNKTISTDIANDIKIIINDIEIERLIDNNLSNAIKHSHDNSEIKVILEKINSEIILQFISEGKNIYDISKIFDKNYTESYGAKRSLGLGLNMVKTICEKNDIYYNADSKNNINTFTYIFKV